MERKNKKKYKKDRKHDKMGWANGAYGACREPPAPQRAAYRISLHRSYPIRACCGQIDDSYTPIRSVRIARRTPARGCGPTQYRRPGRASFFCVRLTFFSFSQFFFFFFSLVFLFLFYFILKKIRFEIFGQILKSVQIF
jgi:hypothetical protein